MHRNVVVAEIMLFLSILSVFDMRPMRRHRTLAILLPFCRTHRRTTRSFPQQFGAATNLGVMHTGGLLLGLDGRRFGRCGLVMQMWA
jgi:hypothetical protein